MANVCAHIRNILKSAEKLLFWHLGYRNPPDSLAIALRDGFAHKVSLERRFAIENILKEPFLWAVPKHRRSIFRRRIRRFGTEDGFWKMIRPKTNLITCVDCGGNREAGRLCPTCYAEVKLETEIMQEAIQKQLGLDAVDKEVVVLYDGEVADQKNEYWKGKRIIEIKKERPSWFGKNLLQPSTQAPATTAAVEPKDLA